MSRVALISGGTSGIGAAIARALQAAGYQVAVNYAFTTDRAEAFQKETGIPAFQWDVRDYDACVKGIAQVEEAFGPVEVLVNNAGITRDAMFHKMTPQQWREVIDTNLTGVFHAMRAVLPTMIEQRSGRIVVTSSMAGKLGFANVGHYVAAKWGVIGLAKSAAIEVAPHGVTVNVICPTNVATDMIQNSAAYKLFRPDLENPTQEDAMPGFQSLNPIPIPWVEPIDISNAMAFLCSDDARYITGETLAVAAGFNASNAG